MALAAMGQLLDELANHVTLYATSLGQSMQPQWNLLPRAQK
jgi:hypothetical protein